MSHMHVFKEKKQKNCALPLDQSIENNLFVWKLRVPIV